LLDTQVIVRLLGLNFVNLLLAGRTSSICRVIEAPLA
jgi:hypothetical protein